MLSFVFSFYADKLQQIHDSGLYILRTNITFQLVVSMFHRIFIIKAVHAYFNST